MPSVVPVSKIFLVWACTQSMGLSFTAWPAASTINTPHATVIPLRQFVPGLSNPRSAAEADVGTSPGDCAPGVVSAVFDQSRDNSRGGRGVDFVDQSVRQILRGLRVLSRVQIPVNHNVRAQRESPRGVVDARLL